MIKRRPTQADVAKKAGVSKTTVTFVLSDRYDISIPDTTRERVKEAAKELGYRPNIIARALVSGKTNAIQIVFPFIGPYYANVLQKIESFTYSNGYHLIASTISYHNENSIDSDLWSVVNNPNDAIIFVDMPENVMHHLDTVLPASKPIVTVGISDNPRVDCVFVDLMDGAKLALYHLLQQNPKRLAMYTWQTDNFEYSKDPEIQKWYDKRLITYCETMLATGRPIEIIKGTTDNRKEAITIIKKYIGANGCPDAIFFFNDEAAIAGHRALKEMGYRMPDDVAIIGFDGSDYCEYVEPNLSTIAQPIEAMCSTAWDLIQQRMQNPVLPIQKIRLDCELIVRASSLRLPIFPVH